MSVFDEIISTVKKTAASAAKKSGEIVDITKAKIQLSEIRDAIRSKFVAIGEACYAELKGDEDGLDISEIINEIDELKEKEAELKAVIAELKSTKKCAECGKLADKEDTFCPSCGEKF